MERIASLCVLLSVSFVSCSHLTTSAQNDEKSKIWLQRAVDEFNARSFAKSLDSTHEAIKLNPSYAAAYNHMAVVHMEMKRYVKSEDAFRKALNIEPDYPEVYNNLGVLYNRQEKYPEAVEMFEKASSYDTYATPENAATNMGYAYFKMGNTVKAKALQQHALDLSPQFCLANKNMGDIYSKEKNFSKAADYFQRAVTNCPLYQEGQFKLSLVLMKLGKKDTAKAHLQKLIERHQSGHFVERSQEILKYLQ